MNVRWPVRIVIRSSLQGKYDESESLKKLNSRHLFLQDLPQKAPEGAHERTELPVYGVREDVQDELCGAGSYEDSHAGEAV